MVRGNMTGSSADAEAVSGAIPYSLRTCRAAVGGPFVLARPPCSACRSVEVSDLRGCSMRDIRGDLQDRASFLEEQISAAQTQFEKRLSLIHISEPTRRTPI